MIPTDDFATLFRYHREADARFVAACRQLAPGQYEEAEPFEVGWPSIRSVVVHAADAADIWSRRFVGETPARRRTEADVPTLGDAERLQIEGHERFAREVLPALTPERLAGVWTYRDIAGNPRSMPLWAALRHVVNHGTYHRGQVASKLKRRGVTPPGTDFVTWAFELTPQGEV